MTKRVLRRPELEKMTGISRSTIYEKLNPKSAYYDPTFPKPVRLGSNTVGWIEDDVNAWISQLSTNVAA